jgi:hypothetical protein
MGEGVVGMDTVIRAPIFVFDANGNDVAIFKTLNEAEIFIEPPDVRDVEAIDADAQALVPVVVDRRVRLRIGDSLPDESRLRSRILEFLAAIHDDEGLAGLDWSDFIAEAEARISTWQKK